MVVNPKIVLNSEHETMGFEVVESDFLDFVYSSTLKSKPELESFRLIAGFISTNSYVLVVVLFRRNLFQCQRKACLFVDQTSTQLQFK